MKAIFHRGMLGAATLLAALAVGSQAEAATPEQKCQAGKNDAAGKYASCLAKAEKSYVLTADMTKYGEALTKCEGKITGKWSDLEAAAVAAGGACPTTGDQSGIEDFVEACEESVADAVAAGGSIGPDPITCADDLETCGDDLDTCNADLLTANGDLSDCNSDLASCNDDLASCVAAGPEAKPLRTGQTTCFDTAGSVVACAGTGQDGELLKGATRSFTDNGDGTVTDNKTGLMWEKLSDDGTIHDWDNTYTWANAFASKVATLNSGSFAGYNDWRVPNVMELQSIVSFGAVDPSTHSAFNSGCVASCTVLTCSCTGSLNYWSSSSFQDVPQNAWLVSFYGGFTGVYLNTESYSVRAVRAGS